MQVAWDTNVLLDYLQYGFHMWDGRELAVKESKYRADLEALDALMNLYILLDFRFHLFDQMLVDAKKELSTERRDQRSTAIDRFASALYYTDYDEEDDSEWEPHDSRYTQLTLLDEATEQGFYDNLLGTLPDGHDRLLVKEAIDRQVHVFLTRDEGILRCADTFKPLGLLITSPSHLCDLIDEAQIPYPNLPAPDLARVSQVIKALGTYVDEDA